MGGPVTSPCCEKPGKVHSLKYGAESLFPQRTHVVCPSRRQRAPREPLTQCLHVHPSEKENSGVSPPNSAFFRARAVGPN